MVNPITGLAENGSSALTKCACTDCVDSPSRPGCSSLFWQPANLAQSCTKPRIAPEAGEALYDVYSTICRSVKSGDTSGNMGWVDPSQGAPQRCVLNNQLGVQKVGPVSDVSMWCASEETTKPSGKQAWLYCRQHVCGQGVQHDSPQLESHKDQPVVGLCSNEQKSCAWCQKKICFVNACSACAGVAAMHSQ